MTETSARSSSGDPDPTGASLDAPLSFLQEQLWLIDAVERDQGLYNEIWVLELDGEVDTAALGAALNDTVARHDALRMSFPTVDGEPRARTAPHLDLGPWDLLDFSHMADDDHAGLVASVARELTDHPYDLEQGPLLRCSLLRFGPLRHTLLVGVHHIVSDGYSLKVLLQDLSRFYRGRVTGQAAGPAPAPARYADFSREQRRSEGGEEWKQALDYWRTQLSGAPPLLDLSMGRLRPARKNSDGARLRIDIPGDFGPGVNSLAHRSSGTRASVLMAAFAAVLHRYTGRNDLMVGTAALGRSRPEFLDLIGYFATTLPLRFRPAGDMPFSEFLDQATDTLYDALDHQALPFGKMIEELRPERDLSYGPVVQVMFSESESMDIELLPGKLSARSEKAPRSRSRFDLVFEVEVAPSGLTAWVEYDTALFTERRVHALGAHYARFLEGVLRDPDLPLSQVPMLAPHETGLGAGVGGRPVDIVLTSGERWPRPRCSAWSTATPPDRGKAGPHPFPGPSRRDGRSVTGPLRGRWSRPAASTGSPRCTGHGSPWTWSAPSSASTPTCAPATSRSSTARTGGPGSRRASSRRPRRGRGGPN
ncbi:condensation domain-containing protein [Nocardiopsis sp. ARC36]